MGGEWTLTVADDGAGRKTSCGRVDP